MAGMLHTIAKRLLGMSLTQPTIPKAIDTTDSKATTEPESAIEPKIVESFQTVVVDRTNKRERTREEVGKEDYLLNQIDEFREKAQQLQELLLSNETKAVELQHIVNERETKAQELQAILEERQKEADEVSDQVTKHIDRLIESVNAKMGEIEVTVSKEMENGNKINAEQISQLRETLTSINEQLETLKGELSEKVHNENVKCYRNIADLFKSMEDKLDKISELEGKIVSVRKCMVAIIVLTAVNIAGLLAVMLMGIFGVF